SGRAVERGGNLSHMRDVRRILARLAVRGFQLRDGHPRPFAPRGLSAGGGEALQNEVRDPRTDQENYPGLRLPQRQCHGFGLPWRSRDTSGETIDREKRS